MIIRSQLFCLHFTHPNATNHSSELLSIMKEKFLLPPSQDSLRLTNVHLYKMQHMQPPCSYYRDGEAAGVGVGGWVGKPFFLPKSFSIHYMIPTISKERALSFVFIFTVIIAFIECLACARHCYKYITCINLLNPPNNYSYPHFIAEETEDGRG